MIGINSQIETGGSEQRQRRHRLRRADQHRQVRARQLEKGGTVCSAGYLGVTSITIDGSLQGLNLPTNSGALVESVQPDSPAAKAGIKGGVATGTQNGSVAVGGDIISPVDGKEIAGSEDLATVDRREEAGRGRLREGAAPERPRRLGNQDVTVTLGKRPANRADPAGRGRNTAGRLIGARRAARPRRAGSRLRDARRLASRSSRPRMAARRARGGRAARAGTRDRYR